MADVEINLEITNPKELVGLGIRAYAIGDFSNAAAAFGRATQLMAQEHGDEHDSLGEVHLHYARSLLEVSREEAEPLGDAIPHGDTDSDSDDETETENGVSDGAGDKNDQTENKDEASDNKTETPDNKDDSKDTSEPEKTKAENGSDPEVSKSEEAKESTEGQENATKETNGDTAQSSETTQGENTEDSSKNEDCTDLQLAWEVLEVAKKIFTNRGDSGKELLAETLILLGEVAMESENFSDGINDMLAGLEIQKTIYESTSRKLAETYYKLGTAHSTVSGIDEAIANFQNSIDTLKKRIDALQTQIEEDKTEKKDALGEEIAEMKALIPEIEEKISDTKSIKEEMTSKLLKEMASSVSKSAGKDEGASSSKVNDISHLVKRKRKADEEPETAEAQPVKKPSP